MPRPPSGYFGALGLVDLLDIRMLKPSRLQLRSNLGEIDHLADSIRRKGVLHPLIVRPFKGYFEIISGHRRYEACRKLAVSEVPCIVRDLDDRDAYEISLIENLQRESLDPLEEAEAFRKYVSEYGWGSITELARKIGKSQEYVSHRILLLQLPKDVKDKISGRALNPSAARELVWLKDPEKQSELANMAIKIGLDVRGIRKVSKLARSGLKIQDAIETSIEAGNPRIQTTFKTSTQHDHITTLKKATLILRVAMLRLDGIIEETRNQELRKFLIEKRFLVHRMVDSCLAAARKSTLTHQNRIELLQTIQTKD